MSVSASLLLSMSKKDGAVPSTSFNTPQLCLKTVYSNELPLLGVRGRSLKNFHQKGGALLRGGIHSKKIWHALPNDIKK